MVEFSHVTFSYPLSDRKALDDVSFSIDPSEFIEGLDLEMMYRNIFLAAEGFFWEFLNSGDIDPDRLELGYMQLIDHWKQIYLRKKESQ